MPEDVPARTCSREDVALIAHLEHARLSLISRSGRDLIEISQREHFSYRIRIRIAELNGETLSLAPLDALHAWNDF